MRPKEFVSRVLYLLKEEVGIDDSVFSIQAASIAFNIKKDEIASNKSQKTFFTEISKKISDTIFMIDFEQVWGIPVARAQAYNNEVHLSAIYAIALTPDDAISENNNHELEQWRILSGKNKDEEIMKLLIFIKMISDEYF